MREQCCFNHPLSQDVVTSGKQLLSYSGTHCPPLMTTGESKRVYGCATNSCRNKVFWVSFLMPSTISKRKSTFLDNDQVQNTEIGINDAAADRLALALASPAGTVAGVSLAKQQAHATVGQHTLLHGKTLLVVASADAHHVSLVKKKVHH